MFFMKKINKELTMAANLPDEMVVRMRDVLATPGWGLCQLAFSVVLIF